MSSSTSAEDGSVFCKTCLQNQHLFTASLAQYLPDDPDAPDYAEREKKYYRFRKGLEQLYPQICAECEPKVRARLERAAYTAKTDMLRRMIDRTNANRNVKSKGWLDLVSLAGRWLWISAFLLQLCWHVRSLVELAAGYSVVEQQAPWIQRAFSAYDRAVGQLPTPQHLTSWALAARVCSLWWNPRFVQSIRGFTKHIRGLPTWYCYQFIAVLIQLAFSKLTIYESADLSQLNMLVGGHALALAFTLYVRFVILLHPQPKSNTKSRKTDVSRRCTCSALESFGRKWLPCSNLHKALHHCCHREKNEERAAPRTCPNY